jgi:SpoVK/Ycf46/Vps4 family AAA+-type ATPase
VGESEKLVVQAFHTARTNAPAVIFIDEFQALFTERSSGSSSRLTTTLLQCMDDLQRLNYIDRGDSDITSEKEANIGRVLVLAATNTPWMIDRAFLRPGRFDRSVFVNLPNQQERISILQLLLKKMKTSLHSNSIEYQYSFLEQLAHKTNGFSGADLAALCRAAAIRCLLDQSDSVRENHFLDALEDGIKASSSTSLVKRIEQWRP